MKIMVINIKIHISEYLKEYITDIANNFKNYSTWKIQLFAESNFISFTDVDEKPIIYSYSKYKIIRINDKVDKVIKKIVESLLSRYQKDLEHAMKGIGFTFDCANLFHYRCRKANLKSGGSYIDSTILIETKINPINIDDGECF